MGFICISDIHGSYKSLIALLKKCPDEEVIFLGDLVDRGPRSKEVVQFAIDEKIPCTMGNHCWLMWASFTGESLHGNKVSDIWSWNGAKETIDSYSPNFKPRNIKDIRKLIPDSHIDFLTNLPYYIEYDDVLLSHTGNGKVGRGIYEKVWERTILDDSGKFLVHGHTPNKKVTIDKISANIDTGCAYKRYGTLSALRWPSMEIFTQENIDN